MKDKKRNDFDTLAEYNAYLMGYTDGVEFSKEIIRLL